MSLSKAERKFLEILNTPDGREAIEEQYSPNYICVMRHRINAKAEIMRRDLQLIQDVGLFKLWAVGRNLERLDAANRHPSQ